MNGTTWLDRTNYFENVPTTALDMALWMESDRMGHLLGAIDQATLDEQRGVVQNEKRQGENQPYGRVDERMLRRRCTRPATRTTTATIGSMADLNAASLDDVKNWFRTLVRPEQRRARARRRHRRRRRAKAKVAAVLRRHPGQRPTMAQPRRRGRAAHAVHARRRCPTRSPQARIYRAWNVAAARPAATRDALHAARAGARRQQDLAPGQAPGLRGQAGRQTCSVDVHAVRAGRARSASPPT